MIYTKDRINEIIFPLRNATNSDLSFLKDFIDYLDDDVKNDSTTMIEILRIVTNKYLRKSNKLEPLKYVMENLGENLEKNPIFATAALHISLMVMPFIDQAIRHNDEWMKAMIEQFDDPNFVKSASNELRSDSNYLIQKANQKRDCTNKDPYKYFTNASTTLLKNKYFVITAIKKRIDMIEYMDSDLLDDYEVGLAIVKRAPLKLEKLSIRLRQDPFICETATNKCVSAQDYALYPPKRKSHSESTVSLLEKALKSKPLSEITELLKTINDINQPLTYQSSKSTLKVSILEIALKYNRTDVIERLITNFHYRPSKEDYEKISASHDRNLFKIIVRKLSANQKKELLFLSILKNHNVWFETLIENLLPINKFAIDDWAYKALINCIHYNRFNMLSMILNHTPANVDVDIPGLLTIAIKIDKLDMMSYLENHGANLASAHRWNIHLASESPLQIAIRSNAINIVRFLLKNEVTYDSCNISSEPALHYAIRNNFLDIASILLQKFPNIVDEKDRFEHTALDIATDLASFAAVELLCQYKAKVYLKGDNSNTLLKALIGKKSDHRALVSYLTNYSPMDVNYILRSSREIYKTHTGITKILIQQDLDISEINKIPAHIKTAHYTHHLSLAAIRVLEQKNIHLIYDEVELGIDSKYLGGTLPPISCNISPTNRTSNTVGVFQNKTKTVMELKPLATYQQTQSLPGKRNLVQSSEILTNFHFIKARNKSELTSVDKLYGVFAYRKENAYLPDVTNNSCRCIIVLTDKEYNSLNIDMKSDLNKFFDFLVLLPRKKIGSDTDVKISKLTERRRALLKFARTNSIKKVFFMDDNISKIAINRIDTDKTPCELVYDIMLDWMNKTKEPIVTVSTNSLLNKRIRQNQVGCKGILLDVEKISQKFPGDSFEALMPYNEDLWGEDYYLQILCHVFFNDEIDNIHGYRIIDPQLCQLERSSQQKSTNAKQGMRVIHYEKEDILHPIISTRIKSNFSLEYELIEKARLIFNQAISDKVRDYESKVSLHKKLDYDKLRSRHHFVKSMDIYLVNRNGFSQSSYESNDVVLSRIIDYLDKNINCAVILFLNRLFYINVQTNIQVELSPHPLLISTINQLRVDKKASDEELAMIMPLIQTSPITVTRVDNFFQSFTSVLDYISDNEGNNLTVLSEGVKVSLRNYQNHALQWLSDCLKNSGKMNFSFNLATGTGKTLLMLTIALSAFYANPKKNVILLFPNIQLVHQTLKKLFNEFKPLLDYFNICQTSVYGVCSTSSGELQKGDVITRKQIQHYKKLHQSSGHIYLFCADSFVSFTNSTSRYKDSFLDNISLAIFDESHQQDTLINSPIFSSLSESKAVIQCYFSATPKKSLETKNVIEEFSYQRQSAINDGYLSPILVDKSLPASVSHEDLKTILLYQQHPNSGPLKNHKGIIYVESRDEASELFKSLQACSDFDQDLFFPFFTPNKERGLDPGYQNFEAALSHFLKQKKGIAIVVQMLVEGFDDKRVDFIINTRKGVSSSSLHQANGRCIRINDEAPNKIGYVILRCDNQSHINETSLLKNASIESSLSDFVYVKDTLRLYSSSMHLTNPLPETSTSSERKRCMTFDESDDENPSMISSDKPQIKKHRTENSLSTQQHFQLPYLMFSSTRQLSINESDSENEKSDDCVLQFKK